MTELLLVAPRPIYLTDQSVVTIKARMRLPFRSVDVAEGSPFGDLVDTVAVENFDMGVRALLLEEQAYLSGATGQNLDARAAERNLTRNAAQSATVDVRFSGSAGTLIALGTRVATIGSEEFASQGFRTTVAAVIAVDGTVTVPCVALVAGSAGNVGAATIAILLDYGSGGVSSLTNPLAAIGGTDTESDAALRARVIFDIRTVSAGGNLGDYQRWTMDVDGVGGVTVVPQQFGPGTVEIYVVGDDGLPADLAVVDAVQADIAPRYALTLQAEDTSVFTNNGIGYSIEDRPDDTGTSVKFVWASPGSVDGLLEAAMTPLLPKSAGGNPEPGIWRVYVRLLANPHVATGTLCDVGVWNPTAAPPGWATTTATGSTPAMQSLSAYTLGAAYREWGQDFYWNGIAPLTLRIMHRRDEVSSALYIDQARFESAFSGDILGVYGRAPVGARVTVHPAGATAINVTATIHVLPTYDATVVVAQVRETLETWLEQIARGTGDKAVRYIPLGAAMYLVPGVEFVNVYTVNGATVDVVPPTGSIGVAGTLTLTGVIG